MAASWSHSILLLDEATSSLELRARAMPIDCSDRMPMIRSSFSPMSFQHSSSSLHTGSFVGIDRAVGIGSYPGARLGHLEYLASEDNCLSIH